MATKKKDTLLTKLTKALAALTGGTKKTESTATAGKTRSPSVKESYFADTPASAEPTKTATVNTAAAKAGSSAAVKAAANVQQQAQASTRNLRQNRNTAGTAAPLTPNRLTTYAEDMAAKRLQAAMQSAGAKQNTADIQQQAQASTRNLKQNRNTTTAARQESARLNYAAQDKQLLQKQAQINDSELKLNGLYNAGDYKNYLTEYGRYTALLSDYNKRVADIRAKARSEALQASREKRSAQQAIEQAKQTVQKMARAEPMAGAQEDNTPSGTFDISPEKAAANAAKAAKLTAAASKTPGGYVARAIPEAIEQFNANMVDAGASLYARSINDVVNTRNAKANGTLPRPSDSYFADAPEDNTPSGTFDISPEKAAANTVEAAKMNSYLTPQTSEAQELIDKAYKLTDKTWQKAEQYHAEGENYGEGTRFASNVTEAVGYMIPSIIASVVTGGQAAGLAVMGIGAAGQSAKQAYRNGATANEAFINGVLNGALEVGTELLGGGIGGLGKGLAEGVGKNVLDKILTRDGTNVVKRLLTSLTENKVAWKTITQALKNGDEGVEEMISAVLQPYIDRMTYDKDAEAATLQDILYQGGMGALVSVVLCGAAGIARVSDYAENPEKMKIDDTPAVKDYFKTAKISAVRDRMTEVYNRASMSMDSAGAANIADRIKSYNAAVNNGDMETASAIADDVLKSEKSEAETEPESKNSQVRAPLTQQGIKNKEAEVTGKLNSLNEAKATGDTLTQSRLGKELGIDNTGDGKRFSWGGEELDREQFIKHYREANPKSGASDEMISNAFDSLAAEDNAKAELSSKEMQTRVRKLNKELRRYNVSARVGELPEGESGHYNISTGEITLSDRLTTKQQLNHTAAHEFAHAGMGENSDLRAAMREAMTASGRDVDADIEKLRARYAGEIKGMSTEEADAYLGEEAAAEFLGDVLDGKDVAKELAKQKPSLLRRILNALENWISNFSGSDEAKKEVRGAAEAVRALLKNSGVQTRELRAPRLTTYAQDQAENESSMKKYYRADTDADTSSIKEQIRENLDKLNEMEPVATIKASPRINMSKRMYLNKILENSTPIPDSIESKDFGSIVFDRTRMYDSLKYVNTDAELAAYVAIPKVLKQGIKAGEHINHKSREYGTITIAAPVEINEKRGNMAVVVRQTGKKYYKVHRILTPDGKVFEIDKDTELTNGGGVTENGSLATPISSASSENSITDAAEKSNISGKKYLEAPKLKTYTQEQAEKAATLEESAPDKSPEDIKSASAAATKKRRDKTVEERATEAVENQKQVSKTDEEYIAAVQRGDMETAQKMVEEAANAAGYTIKAYHGTSRKFNFFKATGSKTKAESAKRGMWFSDSLSTARAYSTPSENDFKNQNNWDSLVKKADEETDRYLNKIFHKDLTNFNDGIFLFSNDYLDLETLGKFFKKYLPEEYAELKHNGVFTEEKYVPLTEKTYSSNMDIWNSNRNRTYALIEYIKNGYRYGNIYNFKAYETIENIMWSAVIRKLTENNSKIAPKIMNVYLRAPNITTAQTPYLQDADKVSNIKRAIKNGKDGIIFPNIIDGGKRSNHYVIFDPHNIKSADPVIYDNDENVIPISERFNNRRKDIRYRKGKTVEERVADAVKEQKPVEAARKLRTTLIKGFGVPEGSRAAANEQIRNIAKSFVKDGKITDESRAALLDVLLKNSEVTDESHSDYYEEAANELRDTTVFVPQVVKTELGDDWRAMRLSALGNKIYITLNEAKSGVPVDVLNENMAARFPGLFDGTSTDQTEMLRNIVRVVENGKPEKMTVLEKAYKEGGDEAAADASIYYGNLVDNALANFADTAGVEMKLRTGYAQRNAELQQLYRDRVQRQADKKRTIEMQNSVQRDVKWLRKKMKYNDVKVQAALDDMENQEDRDTIETLVSNLSTEAKSLTDAAKLKFKTNADYYNRQVQSNPDYIPTKTTLEMLEKMDATYIKDNYSTEELFKLHQTLVEMKHHLSTMDKTIGEAQAREMHDVYASAKNEIHNRGRTLNGTASNLLTLQQLTPMNVMEMIGGWNPRGTFYSFAKYLESGEYSKERYLVETEKMLEDFKKKHAKWLETADGQGKNGQWIEYEFPKILEWGEGDTPITSGETVKVWITPEQRAYLYLESRNFDNLRHMKYGGRTFADKELYSKGREREAFGAGTTIKLPPSAVKSIVADMTPEEKEFAHIVGDIYFDDYSKKKFNETTQLLHGHDGAIGGHYAHIFTDKNYLTQEPTKFDGSVGGVGLNHERVYATAPSMNVSIGRAFETHRRQMATFTGMSPAVRNLTTLLNYTEHGFDNSMRKQIAGQWGQSALDYLDGLLQDVQFKPVAKEGIIDKGVNKVLSGYVTAIFAANPAIVLKQMSSYPMAGAFLGFDTMPKTAALKSAFRKYSGLISKYSPLLDYRALGYSTRELGDLRRQGSRFQKLTEKNGATKFLFGGGAIQWMDCHMVAAVWPWAENYVNKNYPTLKPGTQESIDAGTDPYYKKVADVWAEAVSNSQAMYDDMHRAGVMKSEGAFSRSVTMFHSDIIQQQNTLRRLYGEAMSNPTSDNKRKVSRAVAGILASAIFYVMLNFAGKELGRKDKYYRNDSGELTLQSVGSEMAWDMLNSIAGLVPGVDMATELVENNVKKRSWGTDFFSVPGIDVLNDLASSAWTFSKEATKFVGGLNDVIGEDGSVGEYAAGTNGKKFLKSTKSFAFSVATVLGIPVNNVEKYLLAAVRTINPDAGEKYDSLFKDLGKTDLAGKHGRDLMATMNGILRDNVGEADTDVENEVERLYETDAGLTVVPDCKAPDEVTVPVLDSAGQKQTNADGSTLTEKSTLTAKDKQEYAQTFKSTVSVGLKELVNSDIYDSMTDREKAAAIANLYNYSKEIAKEAAVNGYTTDGWRSTAAQVSESGEKATDYILYKAGTLDIKADKDEDGNSISGSRKTKLLNYLDGMNISESSKSTILFADSELSTDKQVDAMSELEGEGVSQETYYRYIIQADGIASDKDSEGKTISGSKNKKLFDIIDALDLTDDQKASVYLTNVDDLRPEDENNTVYIDEATQNGISKYQYVEFAVNKATMTSDKDKDGKTISGSKKTKILNYIDSLSLTAAQKDILYYAAGYKKSTIYNAPWHGGKKYMTEAQAKQYLKANLPRYGGTMLQKSSQSKFLNGGTESKMLKDAGNSKMLHATLKRYGE